MSELDSPTIGSVFRRNWTVLFIFIDGGFYGKKKNEVYV